MALETAARKLGKDIANEGVQIVDVKYGKDAAMLAGNAMHAAGHGAMTAWNVHVSNLFSLNCLSARMGKVQMAKRKMQAISVAHFALVARSAA